ncbi:MAG TPA: hypothetical protein VM261_07890, partial [Kofleriaceae bacterium]|nr:hypothetical protein [Kofleriaceae bacterium]
MTGSQIDDLFPNEYGDVTHEPQLDHVSIKLASNIDDAWKDGIENIVGKMSASEHKTLLPNTTMTLVLDLRQHGGPLGTFRFTYVDRPDAKKKKKGKDEILVELVSTGGSDAITKDQAKAGKEKFKAHGFTTSGYARDEMEALCHAVALVPESALATIDGVTFKRASAH